MKSVPLSLFLLPLAAMLFSGASCAAEFKSVGAYPAILYAAPSGRAPKRFIAPSGMPLEVVQSAGGWSRVRDAAGDLAWVDTRALLAKRTVVARSAATRIHAAAEDNAAIVFGAERGVLLDMLEGAPSGWVKVRHRDGASGFARAADVWGD